MTEPKGSKKSESQTGERKERAREGPRDDYARSVDVMHSNATTFLEGLVGLAMGRANTPADEKVRELRANALFALDALKKIADRRSQ